MADFAEKVVRTYQRGQTFTGFNARGMLIQWGSGYRLTTSGNAVSKIDIEPIDFSESVYHGFGDITYEIPAGKYFKFLHVNRDLDLWRSTADTKIQFTRGAETSSQTYYYSVSVIYGEVQEIQFLPNRPPNMPSSINHPSTIKGGASCTVSWPAASDPDGNLSGYELEVSVNGSTFTQIYKGSATSYNHYIAKGTSSVQYRVRAYDTSGEKSAWKTSIVTNVLNNRPPNMPASINLPATIKGGASCSISWSAASDPDNNLEGYILERSYDGGSSWAQIYQGSGTSTSTTVPHGTSTVMFRVCAYDTDGERSGWRTSSNKTVLNNRAPYAPPAINVPVTPSGGDPVTITWSAASDPDGNLEGYRLERQWDDKGSWAQVYQGAGLSYTESIPKGEHTSVTYRVQAYDSFGDTSNYTTSPVRTISNNTAPVIQCDLSGDLGDKSEGFVIPYTVTDAENQTVTVTEKVGGMVKRTYQVTLAQSNTFQVTGQYFQKILNGKQTAEIIATDAEGKSSILSLTFTKKVHRAVIMLTEPLAVDKPITVCVIKVVGSIPEDAEFKVEVANNAGDDAPTWEDATDAAKRGINHVFKNKTQTNGWKFGFRVTAARGASDTAGNIVSIQGGFQ